ncbi:MAG: YqgE/AlgH family protein [Bacteroidales bacterium]|nr:YqgE/AlgH family protein [Bacteroidales bacterium]
MEQNNDPFKIEYYHTKLEQGVILVSEPFSKDSYFKRSVILLTEYNEKGSIGFVLNKPVQSPVSEILSDFPEIDADISIGGPVATNTIHFIHTLGDKIQNSYKVFDNLYWGGNLEQLKLLINSGFVKKDNVQFFVGYSGWSPKQLEREISEHYWIVTELDSKKIMTANKDSFWKETLNNLGEKYKIWADAPENPDMN